MSSSRDPNRSKNLVDNIIPSFHKEDEDGKNPEIRPISILSKAYKRISVIIEDVFTMLAEEADPSNPEECIEFLEGKEDDPSIQMKHLLGFLNQSLYHDYLNITHVMRLKKLDFRDLYGTRSPDLLLTRENMLERLMLTITSYFCMGTELRFLKLAKEEGFEETKDDELWHGKSLQLAVRFLPGDAPLVRHIVSSYQKHHAPVS